MHYIYRLILGNIYQWSVKSKLIHRADNMKPDCYNLFTNPDKSDLEVGLRSTRNKNKEILNHPSFLTTSELFLLSVLHQPQVRKSFLRYKNVKIILLVSAGAETVTSILTEAPEAHKHSTRFIFTLLLLLFSSIIKLLST